MFCRCTGEGAAPAVSKAEDKLQVPFYKNYSLLLVFYLWVEGLDLFIARVNCTLTFPGVRGKEKVDRVKGEGEAEIILTLTDRRGVLL